MLLGLLKNMVRARLTPRDDGRTVDVQFLRFGIGWLRIPAPAAAKGVLETTYLDDTLRVSRGDKGNLFVLVREGGFAGLKTSLWRGRRAHKGGASLVTCSDSRCVKRTSYCYLVFSSLS